MWWRACAARGAQRRHRCIGGGIHTPEEYADLDSFAPRFYLLARLIMELGAKPLSR